MTLDLIADPSVNPDNPSSPDFMPEEQVDSSEAIVFAGSDFMSLSAALESLLFVADRPVDAQQLARALRLQLPTVQSGLRALADELAAYDRGIRLQVQGDKVRLVTRPDAALAIEEFLNLDLSTRLSGAALETLAVIAYRQPVTRAQIEAVRGVECGGVLRTLIQRGLVEEVGRLEGVGRPFLYAITEHFMHHFGITNLSQLPPLEDPEKDMLAATMDPLVDALVSADSEQVVDTDSLSATAEPSSIS